MSERLGQSRRSDTNKRRPRAGGDPVIRDVSDKAEAILDAGYTLKPVKELAKRGPLRDGEAVRHIQPSSPGKGDCAPHGPG